MNNNDLSSSAERMVTYARHRAQLCRMEMQHLLAEAQRKYKEIMAELEQIDTGLPEWRVGHAPPREAIRRSQLLHQAAGEFDSLIERLNGAATCLDNAVAAIEGKAGWYSPAREPSEGSLELVAIQAQEEERYRLAREIHDGPAQTLANVALQLEYIYKLATKDSARARDELATIQKDLRLAVGEVRRFMYDLRPPSLEQQGVGAAVESHCQRLSEKTGIDVHVCWLATSSLPASHDTAVFRIVQEALQNIVKHAQATRAEVRATESGGVLQVSISDNGKGFRPEEMHRLDPKHFGLTGMRARAHQIGGSLEISSAPGQGTTVLLRVPLG